MMKGKSDRIYPKNEKKGIIVRQWAAWPGLVVAGFTQGPHIYVEAYIYVYRGEMFSFKLFLNIE